VPYTEIVGHKLEEFVSNNLRSEGDMSLVRFLEKRHWSGVIEIQLRSSSTPRFFDCVINAILKSNEVVGASVLARDITGEREKERRFTQLFETLQEGVYFCTPEGKLLDVNPALMKMLGYQSKEELLSQPAQALNVEADQPPVLGRAGSQS